MSFRIRVTLLCAAALLIALGAAGTLAYHGERAALEGELDGLVRTRAAQVTPDVVENALAANGLLAKQRGQRPAPAPAQAPAAPAGLELVTWVNGQRVVLAPAPAVIPADNAERAIAAGLLPPELRTVMVAGVPSRVYGFRAAPGVTGEVAAPLTQVDTSLRDLRSEFLAVAAAALLLVALLAVLVAWQALRPVAALTAAAERVVRTGDLRQRVGTAGRGRDEIGRLAASLNAMLGALERSVTAQRQLVADASHELGTPLTSLGVNLALLDEPGGLNAADARELLTQARGQAGELAALVAALVELARGSEVELHREPVRLDLLAATAAERARRRAPQVSIREHLSQCTVQGDGDLLERAVGNLLDNAAKWSPAGGRIDLTVADGEVTVADEGPGIAAADLPFVFDRFYRSAAARGLPGSGLGLAIVRQVAELHGGQAEAASPGRGAILRLRLPGPTATSPSVQADHRGQLVGDRPDIGRLKITQDDDFRTGGGKDRVD